MKLLIARNAGFCFGVKRAIDIAFRVADESPVPAVTLGPIIHNPQVIEKLGRKGITAVDTIPDDDRAIIIRTHGIDRALQDRLNSSGHTIIDATCPFVKKAQQYATLLADAGYQVLILGDANHPEVKGILSYAGADAIVIADGEPVPRLKSRVGIVVQTTQPLDALQRLVSKTIAKTKELKVFNTICNSTALRLRETESIARKADVVFVVGGKNSANTTQLTRLAESLGVKTFHIETAAEIREEWIEGSALIGITAGASTPEWIIEEVLERLEFRKGEAVHGPG